MGTDVFQFDATDDNGGLTHITLNLTFAGNSTSGQITGISGTVGSQPILGLSTYNGPDNTFASSPPYFDFNGVSFYTADSPYNIYNLGSQDDPQVLIIADGGNGAAGFSNQPISDQSLQVCFVEGSLIAGQHGGVPVERLHPGDLVRTASGALRPVKWTGHRIVDGARALRPTEVLPVRVARHAFGPDRPSRDLYLSPAHAVCVDILGEVLIPVSSLINGATIQQVEAGKIAYWHVELDSHDVLLAEDLPVESYLDVGNRAFFSESGLVDLDAGPDGIVGDGTGFCRPFHRDGLLVEAARAQLTARARALGWRLEAKIDLRLRAEGVDHAPRIENGTATFPLPRGDVWLVCSTSRPFDVGPSEDVRDLGIAIAGLSFGDGASPPRDIALDDRRLISGFYPLEDGVRRWTGRRALLPRELFGDLGEGAYLTVTLAGDPPPRWIAPAPESEQRVA